MAKAASDDGSFRPALLLTAGRTLATGFTFLIPIVLARRLPPDVFGAYKQLFLVYMTFYALAQMGVAESLYYFLPLRPERGGRFVANAGAVLALSALACGALLTFARDAVATVVGNRAIAPELPLLSVFLGLQLLATVLEITMISRRRYRWASAAYLASDVGRAVLLIGPVLAGAGVRGLLYGAIASAAMRVILGLLYMRREFGRGLVLDGGLLRTQLAYALPFELAVLIETAQATLHQYVVSYRFDAATFALYSIGCLQIPLVDLLASPAASVMMVRMAEARARNDDDAAHRSFTETLRKLALFLFPLFGIAFACGRDLIVFLFTNRYEASAPIFRLWCLCILLAVLPTDGLMRALAETRFLVVVNVARLALIAVTIVPLLTGFGLQGPVIATLSGMALAKVMMLIRYRSRLGLSWRSVFPWSSLFRMAGAAGGALAATLVVSDLLVAPTRLRLVVLASLYGAAYALLIALGGALTPGERQGIAFWRTAEHAGEASGA